MTKLLIHTGGTIGMAEGPQGLAPAQGVVEAAVAGRARVLAFDPLLDSADLDFTHWNRLLDLIEAEAGPVVITHGTDTMCYTGAALSLALADWPHPVVLTGSMLPLGHGGDAEANLELALEQTPARGVWLAFAGKLLPAAALVKADSHQADSFRALPHDPITAPANRRFPAKKLAILTITPGLPPEVLAAMLAPLEGAVLRVFGAGTIPSHAGLALVLRDAVSAGKRLRAVSVCEQGGLEPGAYAAGAALWAAGVQNGGLDTPEMALVKLWLH